MTKQITFKPYISSRLKKFYQTEHVYVCKCDLDQHRIKDLGGVKLYTMGEYSSDHRIKHPTIGTIVSASEGSQFKVGQEIMCTHFAFEDHDYTTREFYTDPETREKYFRITNRQVMFGIEGDELVPREGILLCEGIEGKFADTQLEVEASFEGRRRDIVRVVKPWEGSNIEKDEYLLVKYGGDYEFEWKGKTYLKVDYFFNDAYFKTDNTKWYDTIIHKHVKHGT